MSEGVLADYLARRRAEVKDMFLTEFDQERHDRHVREEGRAEGREEERERTLDGLASLVGRGLASPADLAREFDLTDAEIARIAAATAGQGC